MSVFLIGGPTVTEGLKTSNWNAASNPIIYYMERGDYPAFYGSSGSNLKLTINLVNVTSVFTAGVLCYYGTGIITVQSSSFTGGNTEIIFEEDAADYTSSRLLLLSRKNYRLEISFTINSSDVTFKFWPNRAGEFTIDVSSIVRASITNNEFIPIQSGSYFEEEDDKWTELNDSAITAKYEVDGVTTTDDISGGFPTIKAINAANQLGYQYGSNLIEYLATTSAAGKFLTKFDSPRVYEGWPFSLSFIADITNVDAFKQAYAVIDGADSASVDLDDIKENFHRVVFSEMIEGEEIKIEDETTSTAANLGDTNPANDQAADAMYVGSLERAGMVITAPASGGFLFETGPLAGTKTGNPTNTIRIRLCNIVGGVPDETTPIKTINYTPSNGLILDFSDVSLVAGTDYAFTWEPNNDGTSNAGNYWFLLASLDSGDVTGYLISHEAGVWDMGDPPAGLPGGYLIVGTLTFTTPARTELIETLPLTPTEVCKNPIMLFWKNSLGGDAWWMFDKNQEFTIENVNGRKVKRMVLFAENLTLNEWEGLSELISFRETYYNNVINISSTTRSKSTIGSQVWVVSQDGTATGVVVVPSMVASQTKNETHRLEIEIEFPETYYQL